MKQRLDRPEGCSGESLTAPRLGFELRYVAYYHHLLLLVTLEWRKPRTSVQLSVRRV